MLEKDFVPYEPSLALKELGFDEPCLAWFSETKKLQIAPETYKKWTGNPCNNSNIIKVFNVDCISAPTFSQAFRWFRKNHKLSAIVSQFGYAIEDEYGQIIYNIDDDEKHLCYEEAELACLIKLIEIVKNKQ